MEESIGLSCGHSTTQDINRKKIPTDNIPKGRGTQAKITEYMRKAKSTAGNRHTPPLQPSSQEEEEITPAELEVIRQSERDFEIGSVGNRKSFKGFEKKPDMLKGVFTMISVSMT